MRADATPSRWYALDVGRGLAALAVTLYHYRLGHSLAAKFGQPAWAWFDYPGATLAVPFFFALSGFVISWVESPRLQPKPLGRAALAGYLRRRFWRIYPPYLSAVLIAVAVTAAQGQPVAASDVMAHVGLWHAFDARWFNSLNTALWTISVECCFYLLFPLWLLLRQRVSLPAALGIALVLTAVSFGFTVTLFPDLPAPALMFFLNSWFGWLVGACVADSVRARPGPLPWDWSHWLGLGLTAAAFTFLSTLSSVPVCRLAAILASVLLGAWGVYALARWEPQLARGAAAGPLLRAAVALGLCSYSLYLIHSPVLDAGTLLTRHLAPSLLRSSLTAGWLGIVLLAAWLHYKWIELPSMRRGRSAKP